MKGKQQMPRKWPDFTLGAGSIDASPRTLRAMAQYEWYIKLYEGVE